MMVVQGKFSDRLREIGMFFEKSDDVHRTMGRLCERLEQAGIAYAVMGAMAVNAHGHRRTTDDVDLLLSARGVAAFRLRVLGEEFEPVAGRPRKFRDRQTGVTFDILVAGLFPGSGAPGPIAFPDPALVRERIEDRYVVNLPTLVELKLAARRHKDFGDVVELIRVHDLDESFQDHLHPSIHADYIECLEEKRREDDYEARQDRRFEEAAAGPAAPPPGS